MADRVLLGIPTVVLGVSLLLLLPNGPHEARFLSATEKELLVLRRSLDAGQTSSAQNFHWADVKKAFTTWTCWLSYLAQFGCGTM